MLSSSVNIGIFEVLNWLRHFWISECSPVTSAIIHHHTNLNNMQRASSEKIEPVPALPPSAATIKGFMVPVDANYQNRNQQTNFLYGQQDHLNAVAGPTTSASIPVPHLQPFEFWTFPSQSCQPQPPPKRQRLQTYAPKTKRHMSDPYHYSAGSNNEGQFYDNPAEYGRQVARPSIVNPGYTAHAYATGYPPHTTPPHGTMYTHAPAPQTYQDQYLYASPQFQHAYTQPRPEQRVPQIIGWSGPIQDEKYFDVGTISGAPVGSTSAGIAFKGSGRKRRLEDHHFPAQPSPSHPLPQVHVPPPSAVIPPAERPPPQLCRYQIPGLRPGTYVECGTMLNFDSELPKHIMMHVKRHPHPETLASAQSVWREAHPGVPFPKPSPNNIETYTDEDGKVLCHWKGCEGAKNGRIKPESMKRHVKRHLGWGSVKCKGCKVTFSRIDAYHRHINTLGYERCKEADKEPRDEEDSDGESG
ncbi:zinc finger protein 300-like protein [Moniliophthora roreri]|nr:zinc finger protein 300-like protein [Moniliophthora roreri]